MFLTTKFQSNLHDQPIKVPSTFMAAGAGDTNTDSILKHRNFYYYFIFLFFISFSEKNSDSIEAKQNKSKQLSHNALHCDCCNWKKEKEKFQRLTQQTPLSDPNRFPLSDPNSVKLDPLEFPNMNPFSSPSRLRWAMQITLFLFSPKKHCPMLT